MTGGLGGLGLLSAVTLLAAGGGALVLSSRSGRPVSYQNEEVGSASLLVNLLAWARRGASASTTIIC